jgi:hypothetical protein
MEVKLVLKLNRKKINPDIWYERRLFDIMHSKADIRKGNCSFKMEFKVERCLKLSNCIFRLNSIFE